MTNIPKTAIYRSKLSAPVSYLMNEGYLLGFKILDYGCGRGKDSQVLSCTGYDPVFFPTKPKGKFDIVLCTYVANVLPPRELPKLVRALHSYVRKGGQIFLTTRRDLPKKGRQGRGCWQYNHDLSKWGVSIYRSSRFEIYLIQESTWTSKKSSKRLPKRQ